MACLNIDECDNDETFWNLKLFDLIEVYDHLSYLR